ncbi:hypothetical protein [Bacillus halotolerans]|uniref:hypothetical protein n=1 Tax=Bacillus halotolerans TaxID=260554 RepID=UPI002DBB0301|nr:hypothetical protein [Bacillus halotolerans]MEC1408966.1 hypothetical protein [Bacillus halotolerans]
MWSNAAGAAMVFPIFCRSLIGGKVGSADSRQVARTFDATARMREPPAPQVARPNLPWV